MCSSRECNVAINWRMEIPVSLVASDRETTSGRVSARETKGAAESQVRGVHDEFISIRDAIVAVIYFNTGCRLFN